MAPPKSSDPMEAAWSRLEGRTPAAIAADAGARLLPDGATIRLKVVDRECDVDVTARRIRYAEGEPTVAGHVRILTLHYLCGAAEARLANRLATFREFEGGDVYYAAFKSRAIDRIVEAFGTAPEALRRAGTSIGAEPAKVGEVGLRVTFFPKLPVVVVLWLGDEEVPPAANILFDADAGTVLPTEDLAVVAEALVRRLTEIARHEGH